jgi:hypothetical protein
MNPSELETVRELSKQFDLKESILYLTVVLERAINQQSGELFDIQDSIRDASLKMY